MQIPTDGLGAWAALPFFRDDALAKVQTLITASHEPFLPAPENVFAALKRTQPDAVRVVILGQDPYPTPGHANGLAFSVAPGVALPKSLANIYRELEEDVGGTPPDGDLSGWADQGVLLLNTVLTVQRGHPNSHRNMGWEQLAGEVLMHLSAQPRAFLLWGKPAQKQRRYVLDQADHLFVETAHPSPLSAHRGFFGARPFSRVNEWLMKKGHAPIDWAAPGRAIP
ncbi:MAG: uracil-DNA glycosylase [Pseudomonadota bacterium]